MLLLRHRNTIFFLVLILLCSLLSVLPLLSSGFIKTDDGDWMVIRFSAFYQALLDGQFPVRWLPRLSNSYGYPVANFLYPGFLYAAVPFKAAGLSYVDSVKTILVLSMIGSSAFCFLWLRQMFSQFSSFVGGLIYLFLPYHIYDLYTRGSVGELFVLSVIPFVLWQIERKSILLTGLGIGLLILAHNTVALLAFPVILLYMFLKTKTVRERIYALLTSVLGVFVASFFWIPALYDLSYTVFFQTAVSDFTKYFVDISLVGLIVPLLLFASLVLLYISGKKPSKMFLFFFVLAILSLFFASKISEPIWHIIPISVIQFPFRVLSLLLVSIAFIAAWVFDQLHEKSIRYGGLMFCILLLFPSFFMIYSAEKTDIPDSVYATNEDSTTVQNEYMPKWVSQIPTARPESVLFVGDKPITSVQRSQSSITATVDVSSETNVLYNQYYFPGWNVYVDGDKREIEYEENNGLIVFPVSQGIHDIQIVFEETTLRFVSDALSVISTIGLLLFSLYVRRRYA